MSKIFRISLILYHQRGQGTITQWTHARMASDHLKVNWNAAENEEAEISTGEELITKRNAVFHKIPMLVSLRPMKVATSIMTVQLLD